MFYTGIGSRSTPIEVCAKMTQIARAFDKVGWVLRSGAAGGADAAFERGVSGDNKQIFLPWPGFNGSTSGHAHQSTAAFTMAAELHPAWGRCSSVSRKMHARNMYQVLGSDLKTPSSLVISWTPGGKYIGGTAQAMRLAMQHDIPIFNLGDPQALVCLRAWWFENVNLTTAP